MDEHGDPQRWLERNRFGDAGRVSMPTPLPVGDVDSNLLLSDDAGLTLIDTGVRSPESFDALAQGFEAHGARFEQRSRILLTHAHMDHCGQARRLREISGAAVHASEPEAERMRIHWSPSAHRDEGVLDCFRSWGVPAELLRSDGGMGALVPKLREPLEADVLLADGDTIELGERAREVIETPGHCEGHLVFCERASRTPFELAARLFPRHFSTQLFLVLSEVVGHLDVPMDEGMVEFERRGEVDYARILDAAGGQAG